MSKQLKEDLLSIVEGRSANIFIIWHIPCNFIQMNINYNIIRYPFLPRL